MARRDAAVVLGSFLLLGALAGVLWWALVDPAEFTKFPSAGSAMDEVDLGKQFSADGWYVVIAAVAGLVSGMAITGWRSRDPLLTSALLVVGAALAAAVMAGVGYLLGPGNPQAVLEGAKVGAHVPERLDVSATAAYLAWPIAVLTGALVVLLGRVPDSET